GEERAAEQGGVVAERLGQVPDQLAVRLADVPVGVDDEGLAHGSSSSRLSAISRQRSADGDRGPGPIGRASVARRSGLVYRTGAHDARGWETPDELPALHAPATRLAARRCLCA